MTILIFIIILGLLILSHEFGHFIVAKKSGVRVHEFGFGFPPRLWEKKVGDTVYSINAIPFGGFVKLEGEDLGEVPENLTKDSFIAKPRLVQAAILVAGVFFNLLLAWVLISGGYMFGLPVSVDAAPAGARLSDERIIVTSVLPGSPAEEAGLLAGDTIEFPDYSLGLPDNSASVQSYISLNKDKEIRVLYTSKTGQKDEIIVVPREGVVPGKAAIGIGFDVIGTARLPFFTSFVEGARLTGALTIGTAVGLGQFVVAAFTGQASLEAISGPVGIVGLVGDALSLGVVYLLMLTAIISINLAIINLVPFPALDGGRLLFLLIEALGLPIKPKVALLLNTFGFVLLLLLMVVVTYSDIVKIVSS